MFTDILCRFLIFDALVLGALCCSCIYEHPQKHFCENEFVLKVKVHEEIDLPVGYGFRVEIKRSFKGDFKELNVTESRFVNLEMPPACHIDLMRTGDKYVIFGNNTNGSIYTDICSGNLPWDMTTKFYRRGLRKFYKTGCDCCDEFEPYPTYDRCNWNYSFLKRRGENCNWVKTQFWRNCRKSRHYAQ